MPSSGWCILVGEEPHAMDVLPLISHILWVHGQGMASLWHNQYTEILFIQFPEHLICGTRWFCENYRSTKPSLVWCIVLGEEPHAMYVLPIIPYLYGCMGKVWQVWATMCTFWSSFGFVLSSSLGILSPFPHYPCTRHKWDNIACHLPYCAPPIVVTCWGSRWYPLYQNGYRHLWSKIPYR